MAEDACGNIKLLPAGNPIELFKTHKISYKYGFVSIRIRCYGNAAGRDHAAFADRPYLSMREDLLNRSISTVRNEQAVPRIECQIIQYLNRGCQFFLSGRQVNAEDFAVALARSRGYRKRGGDVKKVPLDEDLPVSSEPDPDLVALDDALNALAEFDSRKAKVVELHFFGGLNWEETAEVMAVSPTAVRRDWSMAKVWLLCELEDRGTYGP
jgi:hypothetical protein